MGLQAGSRFNQREHFGVVYASVESIRAHADCTQKHIRATVRFRSGADLNGRFLMIKICTCCSFRQSRRCSPRCIVAIFAITETDNGVRRAVCIVSEHAGDVVPVTKPRTPGLVAVVLPVICA